MNRLVLVALPAALFMASCASGLTVRGERVRFIDGSSLPPDCEQVPDVRVIGSSEDDADIRARNAAGELEADTLVVIYRTGGSSVVLEANAYRCPETT